MKTGGMMLFVCFGIFFSLNSMAAETVYPTRPIEMTIGFAPGAGTDLGARMIAEQSRKTLGAEIVCVNKPGGAGRVAMTLISKAKPDGYTLGATTTSCIVASPHLEEVPYKFDDFTYIAQYGMLNFGVAVVQNSPFKSFKEVIEFARANPDKLTIGIVGVNTTDHIALQALALFENLKVKFVPFDGAAPTITALLGGHVMVASTASSGYAPHVKAGTVRLLVTYGDERMDQTPDVPTIKEAGFPSLVIQSWYAIYGPKNLEISMVNKLVDAFGKAMMTPQFKKVADELEIYTKKPLFGQELTRALSKISKDNADLYRKVGLLK